MKRRVVALFAGVVAGSFAASVAQAQSASIFLSAGPSFPLGDYGDYAKTGWFSQAGVAVPVGAKGVTVGGAVVYGSNKHNATDPGKTNLLGAFGFLQYRAGNPEKPGIYFFGEAGALNHQFKAPGTSGYGSDSEVKLAVGGGVGVDIPLGGAGLFIEADIVARGDTKFVPIQVGVAIPVGKKK